MIRISRANKFLTGTISLTSSKSITNRALIIRALSGNKIKIENEADASDSRILTSVLEKIPNEINVKDAGTAFRFLTAYLSNQNGTYILTGSARMLERPIGKLVNALRAIGAEIDYVGKANFPPLKIMGKKLNGGKISIDASESSQFISALVMIAPKLTNGLKIELSGKINSHSYIDMTLSMLKSVGIKIILNDNVIEIPKQDFAQGIINVENDWSSASFWYQAAALSEKSEILLKRLSKISIQGDSVIADIMKSFGVESEERGDDLLLIKYENSNKPLFFEYDFSSYPDLVLPLAATCAALGVNSRFNGVKNLRIKESNRLLALKTELEKTGSKIILSDDSFLINPSERIKTPGLFHTYNDHRMIMSLAPLVLIFDKVEIDDHLAVNKSYPGFWKDFKNAGFIFDLPE